MASRSFTLLVESAELLQTKHKCTVVASTLEELKEALIKSLNLGLPSLVIEIYDKEFEEFVGK
jgi:hypothetical protein